VGATLHDLFITWGSFYANHPLTRTMITFAHIGGLVLAGGAAMTVDRGLLVSVRRSTEDARAQLAATRSTHGFVLWGLVLVTISGLLLFAADVDTYWVSRVFWTKMALIALLILNGAVLMRSERRATAGVRSAWSTLRWTAGASLLLWMLTTLAGAALLNL
jgi:cytochrome b subunit of formate dehydrogenase